MRKLIDLFEHKASVNILKELSDLAEARRNPEINRKIGALDALQKYAGRDDVFVSFTADVGTKSHSGPNQRPSSPNAKGAKIGLNPQSQYTTPLGVYCYPIDYVLNRKGSVPFAGSQPFIWVLRANDMSTMLDLQNITAEDVERAKEVCKTGPSSLDFSNATNLWSLYDLRATKLAGSSSAKPMRIWADLLRKAGYSGVIDNGSGTIHDNEATQALFLTVKDFTPLEIVRNIRPRTDLKTPADIAMNSPKLIFQWVIDGKFNEDELDRVTRFAMSHLPLDAQPEQLRMFFSRFSRANIDDMLDSMSIFRGGGKFIPFMGLSEKELIAFLHTNRMSLRMLTDPFFKEFIARHIDQFYVYSDLPFDDEELVELYRGHPDWVMRIVKTGRAAAALQRLCWETDPEVMLTAITRHWVDEQLFFDMFEVFAARSSVDDIFAVLYEKVPHWMQNYDHCKDAATALALIPDSKLDAARKFFKAYPDLFSYTGVFDPIKKRLGM